MLQVCCLSSPLMDEVQRKEGKKIISFCGCSIQDVQDLLISLGCAL